MAVATVAVVAIWQFYLFVNFENSGARGTGTHHLWWAITMAVLACTGAFLVFLIFVRHDDEDDLHITSAPSAARHLN